jgi:RND family efflux transporter MFP subunit
MIACNEDSRFLVRALRACARNDKKERATTHGTAKAVPFHPPFGRFGRSIAGMVLLLALGGLVACSSEPKKAEAERETVSGVPVLTVQQAAVPDLLEAVGTVRAVQTAQLSAQMMGNVVAINVHEGDRVRRGQVLAVIDDAQPRAALDRATAAVLAADKESAAAEAEYTLAQATLGRYQNLFDKKSVSPQEFDEVKARYQAATARRELAHAGQQQARAAQAQARAGFDYARIRAPFDGVVTEKRVDAGALAAPGMPLLTVEDTGRFRLEATVDESEIHFVHQGATVAVALDAFPDKTLAGKVTQIVPAADPASRSFLVKVELPSDPAARSGLFGRARFPKGERQALLVPRSAIVDRGQLQGVYVVGADKIASLRYVTLGKPAGLQVEVLSGLQGGERVVVDSQGRELSGKLIEVKP